MTLPHRSSRFRRMGAATALLLFLAPVATACSASGEDDAADQPGEETTTTAEETEGDETTTTVEDEEPDPTTTTTEADGGEDALVRAFIEGAATELVNDPSTDMDRAQAECTATAWAETLGPDRIVDAGISPETFARGDTELAGQMVDGMTDCGLDLDQMMHDELTGAQGLTQTQADCVLDELPAGALRDLIAMEMAGELQGDDDPIADIFFNAGVACAGA